MTKIGIFRQVRLGASDAEFDRSWEMAADAAADCQHFWRTHGFDIAVYSHAYMSTVNPTPANNYDQGGVLALCRFRKIEYDKYQVWGGEFDGAGGHGELGGTWSVAYAIRGLDILLHEQGHTLGLRHATSKDENGVRSEYDDPTTIMSHGNTAGLNILNYEALGQPKKRLDVTGTTAVNLVPVELPDACLHDDEYHTAVIDRDKPIYLSIYKTKGNSRYNMKRDLLYIHEKNSDKKYFYTTWLKPALKVGESRVIDNIKITFHGFDNEVAQVLVEYDGASVEPVPIKFWIPTKDLPVLPRHAGLWRDKRYPKQGFDILNNGVRSGVFWYTFDADGNQRFYLGATHIDGACDLSVTEMTIDGPVEKHAGYGRFIFDSPTTGRFIYSMKEYGRGCMEIEMISRHVECGAWIGDKPKEGYSISKNTNGDVIAYEYTYGDQLFKNMTPVPYSTQRWNLILNGSVIQAKAKFCDIETGTEETVGDASWDGETMIKGGVVEKLRRIF